MKQLFVQISILWLFSQCSCAPKYLTPKAPNTSNKLVSNFRSEIGGSRTETYDLIFQDTYAKISFKATRHYSQLNHADWMASAFFCQNLWGSYTNDQRKYKSVGKVSIGEVEIPALDNKAYMVMTANSEQVAKFNNMLGKNVPFSINGSSSSGYSQQNTELYIPKPINPEFINGGLTIGNRQAVKRNSTFKIEWDADANNTKGVVLTIENQHKIDTIGIPDMTAQIKYAYNIILMEDDGSYTFQPSDFDGIPDGQELLITLIRGNVIIGNNNGKTVKLYGGEEIFIPQFVLIP